MAFALALVGIGGFVFINPTGSDVYPGPGGMNWQTLPLIYSGLLLALVGVYVLSTLADLRHLFRGEAPRSMLGERPPVSGSNLSNLRRVLTLLCLVFYAVGLREVGFAIATTVLLFVMLRVLGRTDLLRNAVVSILGGLLLWILFVGILKLPLTGQFWDPLTPVLNALYQMTGAR